MEFWKLFLLASVWPRPLDAALLPPDNALVERDKPTLVFHTPDKALVARDQPTQVFHTQADLDAALKNLPKGMCMTYFSSTPKTYAALSQCQPTCGDLVKSAQAEGHISSVACEYFIPLGEPTPPSFIDPDGLEFSLGQCKCNLPVLEFVATELLTYILPAVAAIGCELLFGALDLVLQVGALAIPGVGEAMDAGMQAAIQAAKTIADNGQDAATFLKWITNPCGSNNYTNMVDNIFDPLANVGSIVPSLGCGKRTCTPKIPPAKPAPKPKPDPKPDPKPEPKPSPKPKPKESAPVPKESNGAPAKSKPAESAPAKSQPAKSEPAKSAPKTQPTAAKSEPTAPNSAHSQAPSTKKDPSSSASHPAHTTEPHSSNSRPSASSKTESRDTSKERSSSNSDPHSSSHSRSTASSGAKSSSASKSLSRSQATSSAKSRTESSKSESHSSSHSVSRSSRSESHSGSQATSTAHSKSESESRSGSHSASGSSKSESHSSSRSVSRSSESESHSRSQATSTAHSKSESESRSSSHSASGSSKSESHSSSHSKSESSKSKTHSSSHSKSQTTSKAQTSGASCNIRKRANEDMSCDNQGHIHTTTTTSIVTHVTTPAVTCKSEWAQACYHYRSVMSVFTNQPDMVRFTCGKTASSYAGAATAAWSTSSVVKNAQGVPVATKVPGNSQHHFAWLVAGTDQGWKEEAECDRDEWPPRNFWPIDKKGQAGQLIRYLPASENRGAGSMWSGFCDKHNARKGALGDGAKNSKLYTTMAKSSRVEENRDGLTTTITSVQVKVPQAIFEITHWDENLVAVDDGLWENSCWPNKLVPNDPGFALLTNDPWYSLPFNEPQSATATAYAKPPAPEITNGKLPWLYINNDKRGADELLDVYRQINGTYEGLFGNGDDSEEVPLEKVLPGSPAEVPARPTPILPVVPVASTLRTIARSGVTADLPRTTTYPTAV